MNKSDLVDGCMPTFHMIDGLEQTRVIAKRAGHGAQTADMLRVSPPRVMTAAVSVRDERNAHWIGPGVYLTGLRLRRDSRRVDPFRTPDAPSDSFSSRISKPLSLTTNSAAETPSG